MCLYSVCHFPLSSRVAQTANSLILVHLHTLFDTNTTFTYTHSHSILPYPLFSPASSSLLHSYLPSVILPASILLISSSHHHQIIFFTYSSTPYLYFIFYFSHTRLLLFFLHPSFLYPHTVTKFHSLLNHPLLIYTLSYTSILIP